MDEKVIVGYGGGANFGDRLAVIKNANREAVLSVG
jgi:hypothetical protein